MCNPIITEDLERIVQCGIKWDAFFGKTVLITGANGFLASYLVRTLLRLNDMSDIRAVRVLCIVRSAKKAVSRFKDLGARADLVIIEHDVTKYINTDENIDFIIHAASQASPKYYGSDPVGTLSANVLGTYNTLELAKEKAAKGFMFFSSGEVYGVVDKMPIHENSYGYVNSLDVRSCYAESKRMGENMCVSWQHQYEVPIKIVRPFHTYGPGMILDDGRVFADFVADIVNGRNIVMKSDGSAKRAFCYIADATEAFFKVLLSGVPGEAYNVGNENCEISILQLAEMLVSLDLSRGLKVIRKEVDLPKGYLKSKIVRACPDTSKLRKLGWSPNYSIKEGFERTIRSFMI